MAEIEGTFIDKNGCTRDAQGKLVKGSKPPNPSGRPKGAAVVRELAQTYTEDAMRELYRVMTEADKDRDRMEAAKYILDRGWGKPATSVEVQRENGESQIHSVDLTKLTAEELDNLEGLIGVARSVQSEAQGDEDEESGSE